MKSYGLKFIFIFTGYVKLVFSIGKSSVHINIYNLENKIEKMREKAEIIQEFYDNILICLRFYVHLSHRLNMCIYSISLTRSKSEFLKYTSFILASLTGIIISS